MVALNRGFVMDDLQEVFVDLYERMPERFDLETKIIEDLHADLPDRSFIKTWMNRVAKKSGVNENKLKIEDKEYKIWELIEEIRKAGRKRYDGESFYSVSKDINIDRFD